MNEQYKKRENIAPQYDPEAAHLRRAVRAEKARRRRKKRIRRLILLALAVLLALVVLPRAWDGAERLLYPCKYEALVDQWAETYDLDPHRERL